MLAARDMSVVVLAIAAFVACLADSVKMRGYTKSDEMSAL